jgi:hypothetical protein
MSPDPDILPPDFDEEARLELLFNFLNTELDHFQVAHLAGLRLSQYHAYINSEEFQKRLADQTAIADLRTRAAAALAQPKAIAVLERILDSYTDAERNELVDDGARPSPRLRATRQRHRESARRAAWLLLKVSGAIPPALAARALALSDAIRDSAHDSPHDSAPAERAGSIPASSRPTPPPNRAQPPFAPPPPFPITATSASANTNNSADTSDTSDTNNAATTADTPPDEPPHAPAQPPEQPATPEPTPAPAAQDPIKAPTHPHNSPQPAPANGKPRGPNDHAATNPLSPHFGLTRAPADEHPALNGLFLLHAADTS